MLEPITSTPTVFFLSQGTLTYIYLQFGAILLHTRMQNSFMGGISFTSKHSVILAFLA
jgi:hypothetical protein